MAAVLETWKIAKATNRMLAAPESSDKDDNMTQKPKQKSSQHRYTGALAVPLKPRQKYRRPHALRYLRTLGAKASRVPAPTASPGSSNSVPESLWALDLSSLLPSGQSGAIGATPSFAPAPPMFSDSLYADPRWRWEFDQKLLLLLDHYAIARTDAHLWQRLCLNLAMAHVPGFQERAGRAKGRPRGVPLQEEEKLYARFCALQKDGHTDRNAARIMAKELGKSGREGPSEASILRRMQRRKQTALAASKSVETWLAGLAVTQNPLT